MSVSISSPKDLRIGETVTMDYIRNESSTVRRHLFVHCDKAKFCAAKNKPWKASVIVDASYLVETSLADRSYCPACQLRPSNGMRCACRIPFSSPSSALDYSTLRPNHTLNAGEFKARAFVEQAHVLFFLFASVHVHILMLPRSLVHSVFVLRCTYMFCVSYLRYHLGTVSNIFLRSGQGTPYVHVIAPGAMTEMPSVYGEDPSESAVLKGFRDMAIQERLTRGAVPRSPPALLDAPSSKSPPSGDVLSSMLKTDTPASSTADCALESDAFCDSVDVGIIDITDSAAGAEALDWDFFMEEYPAPEFSGIAAANSGSTPSGGSVLSGGDTDALPEGVPEIGDAALLQDFVSNAAENSSGSVDAKEAYRLERQRRNRISAAKSNAKRRAYRDGLKSDLAALQARKSELKHRETEYVRIRLEPLLL